MREYYDITKALATDVEYTMILSPRLSGRRYVMERIMANSLRAKLTKLRHDRRITEEEYQELIKKLDEHDAEIGAEMISIQSDVDRCVEAQIRLTEFLNKFWDFSDENDAYSAKLVYEILSGIRFDAKFDEDGMFDLEATENNSRFNNFIMSRFMRVE